MNYKYLSKLKPSFHQMRAQASPRIAHFFSVVGHQTFGHFLTTADPVMTQLTSLNNHFANNLNGPNCSFRRFTTSVLRPQTLEAIGNRIDIEDSQKRKFNIFEVLAYCLFIEMKQEFKNFKQSAVILDQVYKVKRDKYFDYFQIILNKLRDVEQMRFGKSNQFLPTYKNHILDCQIKFAKKQIYRRLHQMCRYSQKDKEKEPNSYIQNILVNEFICRIDLQYHSFSKALQTKFSQGFQNKQNHIFDEIYSQVYSQKYFHPFITQEIKSLFADQIQKGYYSPLLALQYGYINGRGFGDMKDEMQISKAFESQAIIKTFSFIPTDVTKKLHLLMQAMPQSVFISSLVDLGKSSNLLLLTILRGYTNSPKYVLFPQFDSRGINNLTKVYMCIVQSLWKELNKQEFIKVEQYCNYSLNKYNMTSDTGLQNIFAILSEIKNKTRGLILDQMSFFDRDKYQDDDDSQKSYFNLTYKINKFLLKVFEQIYHVLSFRVICCSSVSYQLQVVSNRLWIQKQQINLLTLQQNFTGALAHHLFIVLLKFFKQNLIFLYKLEKEFKEKRLQESKNRSKITQEEYNEEKNKIKQTKNQIIQNIQVKIELIAKLSNKDEQFISGSMSVIKECAKRIIQKLFENPETQITEKLINDFKISQKVKYYKNLIFNWIQVGQIDIFQFIKRKQIIRALIRALIMSGSLQRIQYFYRQTVSNQLPRFLYQSYINDQDRSDKRLKTDLQQIKKQLWIAIKHVCLIGVQQLKDQKQYIDKLREKTAITSRIQFLVQLHIKQIIDSEEDVKSSCLLKTIMTLVYPQKISQLNSSKALNFGKTIGQKDCFQEISEKIHLSSKKCTELNTLFKVPLASNFPECNQYLIHLQKTKSEDECKIQASVLHIEVGVSKGKADLEIVRMRVDSKQKAVQNFSNRLKAEQPFLSEQQLKQTINQLKNQNYKYFNEYESKMRNALKQKGICLKSYDILLITGLKANEFDEKWKTENNVKVLNLKEIQLIKNQKSIKRVHQLLNVGQRIEKEKGKKGKNVTKKTQNE